MERVTKKMKLKIKRGKLSKRLKGGKVPSLKENLRKQSQVGKRGESPQ
jgi:hypothetical protein